MTRPWHDDENDVVLWTTNQGVALFNGLLKGAWLQQVTD